MIDFEKFGYSPKSDSDSEREEESGYTVPQEEETEVDYVPVPRKIPGKANIVVAGRPTSSSWAWAAAATTPSTT